MKRLFCLAPLALALGCPAADDSQNASINGGKDSGTGDSGSGSCGVHLTSLDPADGGVGVYYRDPITLSFDGDASAALIEVRDPSGTAAAMAPTWSDGNVQVTLAGVLAPSTSYTIHVELCDVTTDSAFMTSDVGTPLAVGNDELVGRTFSFAIADAEITEPSVLEMFDDGALVAPLGFEVEQADDSTLTLLGALCAFDGGETVQVSDMDTWDFPAADFTQSPYFETATDYISLDYLGYPIPLYDFAFSGNFNADGTAIVKGRVEGLVDTRSLGPLFNLDDSPDAVCVLAGDVGVYCTPCPSDSEEYCLFVVGEDITAPWVEGLDIEAYPPS